MAQQLNLEAVSLGYEPSVADALDYASIAEEALGRGAYDRCAEALARGARCVAVLGQRRTDEHLHVAMRSLTETVDGARRALEDGTDADSRARKAIAALRWAVRTVDDGAGATAGRWDL